MRQFFRRRGSLLLLIPVAVIATALGLGSTLNLPFTFSSGQVIYASQMNSNFQAIRAVVNALDDQNIANTSITASLKLIDGTVSLAKMGADSVNSAKIVDGSIVPADLATDSVTTVKILDGNVTTVKILDGTILPADLASDSVTEPKIDFANAPTNGFDVFWNGTKLDYRARVTASTTCVQVLTSRGTHAYSLTLTTNDFSSWVDLATPAGTSADTTPIPFRNPKAITFCTLNVVMDTTPPIATTFSLRQVGSTPINPSCTVSSGGPTTCTDVVNCTASASGFPWVLQTSAAAVSAVNRSYSAYLCTSPF